MSLTIDAAGPDDVDTLVDLAAQTFPLACPPHMPPEAIAQFLAQKLSAQAFGEYLADPEADLIAARRPDGELAGYALGFYRVPPPEIAPLIGEGRAYDLSKLYVRPGGIGSGIGYALLGRARELAVARGAALIWLGTNQHNTRSQAFYDRTGFEQVGTRRFTVGTSVEDDFVYALKL